jgi:hypothetical protein
MVLRESADCQKNKNGNNSVSRFSQVSNHDNNSDSRMSEQINNKGIKNVSTVTKINHDINSVSSQQTVRTNKIQWY